jgi:hypothetical protein
MISQNLNNFATKTVIFTKFSLNSSMYTVVTGCRRVESNFWGLRGEIEEIWVRDKVLRVSRT